MKKYFIFLSMCLCAFVGFTFAGNPSILSHSYLTQGNDVSIYWVNNSNSGYLDINVQDPKTQDRLHFGTVKISDQTFSYTKQWDGDQNIWLIPSDGGDEVRFTIPGDQTTITTRTAIPSVPKTGPSGHLIGIILATLIVFGGYIYIKKRADI